MGALESGREAPADVSLLLYDASTERQAKRDFDLSTSATSTAPGAGNSALATPRARPVIIPRASHSISRAQISPQALKVLYRLKDAGYQAFLVGGSVRDLLLGIQPKDFDVATDALPEEIEVDSPRMTWFIKWFHRRAEALWSLLSVWDCASRSAAGPGVSWLMGASGLYVFPNSRE